MATPHKKLTRARAIEALGGYFERIARTYSRDHGVTVVVGKAGSVAAADLKNRRIYLPADVEYARKEMRPVIEGLLDHETAHIRAEVDFKGASSYSHFAEMVRRDYRAEPVRQRLMNIYEDARIEREASAKWPGVANNLRQKNLYFKGVHGEHFATGEAMSETEAFLRLLNLRLRLGEYPDYTPSEYISFFAEFEDIVVESLRGWSPHDTYKSATATYERLKHLAAPPPPDDSGGAPNASEDASADAEGSGEGSSEDASADAEGASVAGEGGERSPDGAVESRLLAEKILASASDDLPSMEHDEEWVSVLVDIEPDMTMYTDTWHLPHPDAAKADERVVPSTPYMREAYAKARAEAAPVISTLARRLTMLLRARVPRVALDLAEGEIDDDALVGVALGERRIFTGETGGIDVDAAWSVLVDQSGSMMGSKIGFARTGAVALGEALYRCGIEFEMHGWQTDTNRATGLAPADDRHTRFGAQRTIVYKAFSEKWPRTRRRCGAISAGHENDDVTAIYEAARRLLRRREKHKILCVLTDGQPAHAGLYNRRTPGGGFDRAWGSKQLADTIKLVRAAGIVDVGVGMMCGYVESFYTHHFVVSDMSEFAPRLLKVLKRSLAEGW